MADRFKIENSDSGGYSPPSYYKEPNPAVIDPDSEESLSKWENVLHLSRKELLKAIDEFGPMVKNIRKGLRARENAA